MPASLANAPPSLVNAVTCPLRAAARLVTVGACDRDATASLATVAAR
ncbi:MAG TPA: hypothetical protein VGG39_13440 [Polyangiaceae bacterium]